MPQCTHGKQTLPDRKLNEVLFQRRQSVFWRNVNQHARHIARKQTVCRPLLRFFCFQFFFQTPVHIFPRLLCLFCISQRKICKRIQHVGRQPQRQILTCQIFFYGFCTVFRLRREKVQLPACNFPKPRIAEALHSFFCFSRSESTSHQRQHGAFLFLLRKSHSGAVRQDKCLIKCYVENLRRPLPFFYGKGVALQLFAEILPRLSQLCRQMGNADPFLFAHLLHQLFCRHNRPFPLSLLSIIWLLFLLL